MSIHSVTYDRRTRSRQAVAAIAAFSLAALALPGMSIAHAAPVNGVRAVVVNGTLEVRGDDQNNSVALRLASGDASQLQVDVGNDGTADFTFPRAAVSAIDVRMGAGDDTVKIDDTNGPFTTSIPTTISGGPGNDNLTGGAGAETFLGGPGDDTVTGGRGNDIASLNTGDDTFVWNPGDASDVIQGGAGTDTMVFNGANVAENFTLAASGQHMTLLRNIGNVTMDTDSVEEVDLPALGGSDNITVNDLSGTDVTKVNLDLAGTLGGANGDGAVDTVTVLGTHGDDAITATGNGFGADLSGLPAAISVVHGDPNDQLAIDTLGGHDTVSSSGVFGMQVTANGTAL
jgi:RTX calcium-binding nonapeptide repeat (4 copies)